MVPKAIGNNALDEEYVILECELYIIYSLKELLGIMVTAQDIIRKTVSGEDGLPQSSSALRTGRSIFDGSG